MTIIYIEFLERVYSLDCLNRLGLVMLGKIKRKIMSVFTFCPIKAQMLKNACHILLITLRHGSVLHRMGLDLNIT